MTPQRDRYRPLTAAAVLLVAGIAATVSYLHIVNLALRFGQEPLAAYLLPVSIDGLVAVSSLALLRSARAGVSAPWLARAGLVLAVAATLAANVASGLAHGWPGAVLSGWPGIAFVIAAEIAISMSRTRPQHDRAPDKAPAKTPVTKRPAKRTQARTAGADTEAAILSALTADPDMATGQIAAMTGVSDRTVRRVRARLAAATD